MSLEVMPSCGQKWDENGPEGLHVLFVQGVPNTQDTQTVLRKLELDAIEGHKKDIESKEVNCKTHVEFDEGFYLENIQLWPVPVFVGRVGVGFFVAKPIVQVQDGQLCICWYAKGTEVVIGQRVGSL